MPALTLLFDPSRRRQSTTITITSTNGKHSKPAWLPLPQISKSRPLLWAPFKRIILIALIAVVAAVRDRRRVWFFMSKRAPAAATAAALAPAPAPTRFPARIDDGQPASDDGQQHFLRIGLTLKLTDPKTPQEPHRAHAGNPQPRSCSRCRTIIR